MRVFITGGTGFVGRALSHELVRAGHSVTILTRRLAGGGRRRGGVSYLEGDPTVQGDWQRSLLEHQAVINLAGAPIFRRWSLAYKHLILNSRVKATSNIVKAIRRGEGGSISLFNASAVGYYGFRGEEVIDEGGSTGSDFLAKVAHEWEAAALKASGDAKRVVLCRFGIVLGPGGGALREMVSGFRRYPPVVLGSGRQWLSWVHIHDLARIFIFLLDASELSGPVNCTAPEPVRNRELTEAVASRLGRRVFPLKVPGFLVRLALGDFGQVLLEGQRAKSARLLDAGFRFEYPDLESALTQAMGISR